MSENEAQSKKDDPGMLVVEIGKKQKRKRIRQLRKGKGRLFERVRDMVTDMREQGAIDAKATPVVVVVRQKSRGGKFGF